MPWLWLAATFVQVWVIINIALRRLSANLYSEERTVDDPSDSAPSVHEGYITEQGDSCRERMAFRTEPPYPASTTVTIMTVRIELPLRRDSQNRIDGESQIGVSQVADSRWPPCVRSRDFESPRRTSCLAQKLTPESRIANPRYTRGTRHY